MPFIMDFHAKKNPIRSCRSRWGLFVSAYCPCTSGCQATCTDNRLLPVLRQTEKCDDSVHGLPPPFRDWGSEKGRSASITHALTQYNKKPPGIPTTGGLCFVHCMNPMDKFSSPYLSLVYALWRKSQGCTRKFTIYFALGNALFQVSITLNFGVQPSGLKVSALLASMMPCSAFPLSAGIFVVIFLRSSKNLCHF